MSEFTYRSGHFGRRRRRGRRRKKIKKEKKMTDSVWNRFEAR